MKILFLAHNGHPYGANKSLYSIMKYLSKKNQIQLFTPFQNSFVENNDIENYNIPYFPSVFFYKRTWKYVVYPLLMCLNIIVFPYLLYRLKKFNPDIIYSNSSVENMGKILSLFSKAKHIVHVREFGDLDYNFLCIFGKKFKRHLLSSSNGIIFNSKIVQETVMPIRNEIPMYRTIYNGITANRYTAAEKKQTSNFRVAIVGFIHPEKGQLDAIKYMAPILQNNNNISFHIYGTGQTKYLDIINKYLEMNNLKDKVILEGFINDTDSIYREIDIALVFSKNEAFGRVTIESMLRGIPVIAYNGGGTMEIIDNMNDGLLFSTKTEFESCFYNLYNDECLYKKISDQAKRKINQKFSEEQYVYNVEQFIINVYESGNC